MGKTTYLPTLLALLTMLFLANAAFSQPPSIEILLEDCAKKTVVYGQDGKGGLFKKGKHISGQCAGFLEGVLSALEHENLACPKWRKERIGTEFLLSVVELYAKENPQKGADAGVVVSKAFKRAFHCDKN